VLRSSGDGFRKCVYASRICIQGDTVVV
jgi:hypothetical protein